MAFRYRFGLSFALCLAGCGSASNDSSDGAGGSGAGGELAQCGSAPVYFEEAATVMYSVTQEPWCTDCAVTDMRSLDPDFDDMGFTPRFAPSPAGDATLIAVSNSEHAANWADMTNETSVTALEGVVYGTAFTVDDAGLPWFLFPTPNAQLRLRGPSGEESVACLEPERGMSALGIAIEGDDAHAVASVATEEFSNVDITTYARTNGTDWIETSIGTLSEGPMAVARTSSGKWLVAGLTRYVDSDLLEGGGIAVLGEDLEERVLHDLESPIREEDFYGPFFQPHPRLQIVPGEDDYFAIMVMSSSMLRLAFHDGRVLEIPVAEYPEEQCEKGSGKCPATCTVTGNLSGAASAIVDGDSLYLVFPRYVVNRASHFDADCNEVVDVDEEQGQISIARYDLETLEGGIIHEIPISATYYDVWLSAARVGDELVFAFKVFGNEPAHVGTLDMNFLRTL